MSLESIRVGTVGYPIQPPKKVLNEVDIVEITNSRAVPPKASTGRKWREAAPARVSFSTLLSGHLFEPPGENSPLPEAPDQYGGFRATRANLGLWERNVAFARELGSDTLVLITTPGFTPTRKNKEALSSFLAQADRHGMNIAWEPHGPWDQDDAASWAEEHGLLLAVDPLRDAPPRGPRAYLRLGPFAAMGRLGVYDLERLAEIAEPFERASVLFDTPRALDDVRNLKRLLAEM